MATGTWTEPGQRTPHRVTIKVRLGTNVIQTGFKLRRSSLTTGDAQEMADAVQDWVGDQFRNLFFDDEQMLGVDVVDMLTKEGGSTAPVNMMGTIPAGTNRLPAYVMAPFSFKSEFRARYGQARMFIPVRSEAWSENDALNAAGLAAINPVMADLLTRFISPTSLTDFQLIGAHGLLPSKAATPSRPARPEIQPTWYDIQTGRLNAALSFVRSRKAGKGS